MAPADLYFERIDFRRYFQEDLCSRCGFASCGDFIEAVKKGFRKAHECPVIDRNRSHAYEVIGSIKDLWPEVPLLVHPRPGYTGLLDVGAPSSESLLLVTGNNEYTQEVLLTVLGTTICPFYLLCVDTGGNTLDMSMVYGTFTAEKIEMAMKETGVDGKTDVRELIIPGLAEPIVEELQRLTGWSVRVGPVCAAELPLFLSEIWFPPNNTY